MTSKETGKQEELRCQRCSHEWEYRGQNPYFTLCPHCRTTVRIRKKEGREVIQPVQVEDNVQADRTNQAGILGSRQQLT